MPSMEGGGVEKNLIIVANYISKNIKNASLITFLIVPLVNPAGEYQGSATVSVLTQQPAVSGLSGTYR